MSTILIVEDDKIQLQTLCILLSEYNSSWSILKAATYEEAINYIENDKIQLFLLDVELSKENSCKNGIELGKIIRKNPQYAYTPILFITSIPEKIQEALNETHCYHYLLKPYNKEQFYSVLDAIAASPLMEEPLITIKDNFGIYTQIKRRDILYIASEKRQLLFYTPQTVFHAVGMTLESLSTKLGSAFSRCHKKYWVNLKQIKHYDKTNRLLSIQDTRVPVGRIYKETFEKQLEQLGQ